MVLNVADFYFEIGELRSESAKALCADYICGDPPRIDADVRLAQADVDAEAEAARRFFKSDRCPMNVAWTALYRKICAFALAHDAFLMHCAVIGYEGRGYAFSAPSGTGKTTHIRLWQQAFGADKVTIVNGDKPILRLIDGTFYAYGTPWCGKEGYNTNTRVPLAGLCFVERGAENSIRRMTAEEAVPHLFTQIMVGESPDLGRQMELADALLTDVPCYLLRCNMDPAAAVTARDGMRRI